jgi:MFS family permease
VLAVKESLTAEETESGLKQVVKDGLASQAMVTLTGGAFLVAFALKLGASNVAIGLLAAIPFFAQLIQVPSVLLVQKFGNRRLVAVGAAGISRVFWLFIALIPFLFSVKAGLLFLVVGMFLHSAFGAIVNMSWTSWMRDLVPQERLGSFFSRRLRLATGLGLVISVIAALYLDLWKKYAPNYELQGYSVLFFLGFVAGILGVYFISTIPEPRMAPIEAGFFKLFSQPFRDKNFRNLIRFSCPWNFAVNLAAPFFTVYMIKRLEFGMSAVIGLTVLSQLMNLSFLQIWGRLTDRFSNKSVLAVSGPLFMLCVLGWTFTTLPEKHALTVPMLIAIHVLMGISLAGVTLSSANIGLKLAPRGEATSYLATNNLMNSVAAGLGPILGGQFADFFTNRELSSTLEWRSPNGVLLLPTMNLQQWDFFFLFAFVIGLYAIHRLASVSEVGEVDQRIVVRELISESVGMVRNLSSAGGIRFMMQLPLTIFKRVSRKGNKSS